MGDSGYVDRYGVRYGSLKHTFAGDLATKQAKFQFDLERPSHCLLENDVADVIDQKEDTNCTVFPISLDEDIRSVISRMCSAKAISRNRVAQKVSYRTLSISSLNIDQFSHFFHQETL